MHLAWLAANRICAKRLVPFLPTLVEALERHGHLQLTPEVCTQLLTISSATDDQLLRPYRVLPRSRSTTRAGTLLKKQIPVRTFHGWDDAQPGFLEIDVMAHCGTLYEGSYLSTLTLTDSVLGLETILGAFVAGVILKLVDGDPIITFVDTRKKRINWSPDRKIKQTMRSNAQRS